MTVEPKINSNGYVGIGTPTPTHKLHVLTSVNSDTGASRILAEVSGSPNFGEASLGVKTPNGSWEWFMDDISGNNIGTGNKLGLFQSGPSGGIASRMVFDANGQVGIGTSTPGALLDVNGVIRNATGVVANVSDVRLKRDIQPLEGSLEKVKALQGVSFHWKDAEKDKTYGLQRGFIAQDVEKVIPEWVKTAPDGIKSLEKVGVEAILVEAIKEQQSQIEGLKSLVCLDHPDAAACK